MDVKIFRRGNHRPVKIFQDVTNGSEAAKVVAPGRYNTQIFAANNNQRLVKSGFVGLKARNLYIEYVFGSPKSNSLTIVTQTIRLPR
ncbi:MAG: hypothetical protein HC875_14480 [Anaerolineales bacterium]|nr:hypothetical protein [Anaerolineales bacterium]